MQSNYNTRQENVNVDYEAWTLRQILTDLETNGFEVESITEIDVLKYADEYRNPSWLVRELKKLAVAIAQPVKPAPRKRRYVQRTKGRSAASIVTSMNLGEVA